MPVETNEALIKSMSAHFLKFRQERKFCDVILKSGTLEIHAHCIVLASLSDYFDLLFKYEGSFQKSLIQLDENTIPEESLESIVDYAYTGIIDITEINVFDLLFIADFIDIPFIKRKCEKYLLKLSRKSNYFTRDNLIKFTSVVYLLNPSSLLSQLRKFISNNFIELSRQGVFSSFPLHCLSTLLESKQLTVMDHGIPVEDVEAELLRMIVDVISDNCLSDPSITKLLWSIDLMEIEQDVLLSVLDLCPRLKHSEAMNRISMLKALPSLIEDDKTHICRKYSKTWKYVDKNSTGINKCDKLFGSRPCNSEHNIDDDRIMKIKTLHLKGVPYFMQKTSVVETSRSHISDILSFSSIVGLVLTLRSGKTIKKGNTSKDLVFPLDHVICEQFSLAKNEVIVEIKKSMNGISYIQFITSFGNCFCPTKDICERDKNEKWLRPDSHPGYLYSFNDSCSLDDLQPLWVEFSDPNPGNYMYYDDDTIDSDDDI